MPPPIPTRRRLLRLATFSTLAALASSPARAARRLAGGVGSHPSPPPTGGMHDEPLHVAAGERLLVIAPHPDDESIAAGGLVQRVVERGGSALVVLVTAGDGFVSAVRRETRSGSPAPAAYIAYGVRRVAESRAAMRALASERVAVQLLGFPDGGLDRLLRAHWRDGNPWRSVTTAASDPPYDHDALAPDAPYDGSHLRRELARVVRESRPTTIVLPDPLDRHPDHRAAGIFTLLAIDDAWQASLAGAGQLPRLLSYVVHWPAWPPLRDAAPAAQDPRAVLALPPDLPRHGIARAALVLDDREIERKRAAMALYASQQAVMPGLLAAFVRRTEPFLRLGGVDVRAAASLVPALHDSASQEAIRH